MRIHYPNVGLCMSENVDVSYKILYCYARVAVEDKEVEKTGQNPTVITSKTGN